MIMDYKITLLALRALPTNSWSDFHLLVSHKRGDAGLVKYFTAPKEIPRHNMRGIKVTKEIIVSDQKMSNMFGIALLAGALGAGIGLIFAPRSGKETRDKLSGAAKDARDQTQETLHQAQERMHRGLDQARDLKTELADAMKRKKHNAKKEIQSRAEDASDELKSWEGEA